MKWGQIKPSQRPRQVASGAKSSRHNGATSTCHRQLALGASAAQLYAQITSEDFRDANPDLVIEVTLVGFSKDEEAAFPDEINADLNGGPSTMTVRVTASVDSEDTLSIERIAVGSGTRRQLSRMQLETIGWRFLGATSQSRELRSDRRSALTVLLAAVELGAEQADFDKAVETLADTLADSKVLKQVRQDLASQLTNILAIFWEWPTGRRGLRVHLVWLKLCRTVWGKLGSTRRESCVNPKAQTCTVNPS